MMKLVYEFLGTLALAYVVFKYGKPLHLALVFGAIALLVGPVSGGHVNPAISFAMMAAGKLSRNMFYKYAVVQVLGAYFGLKLARGQLF